MLAPFAKLFNPISVDLKSFLFIFKTKEKSLENFIQDIKIEGIFSKKSIQKDSLFFLKKQSQRLQLNEDVLIRKMDKKQFFKNEKVITPSISEGVPVGIIGRNDLFHWNEDGTFNHLKTQRQYELQTGAYQPSYYEKALTSLGFSTDLFNLHTHFFFRGKEKQETILLLVDLKHIPKPYYFKQNYSEEEAACSIVDSTGEADILNYEKEKEVTIHDVSLPAIIGFFIKSSGGITFKLNEFYIHDISQLNEDMQRLFKQTNDYFFYAATHSRTKNPLIQIPHVTFEHYTSNMKKFFNEYFSNKMKYSSADERQRLEIMLNLLNNNNSQLKLTKQHEIN